MASNCAQTAVNDLNPAIGTANVVVDEFPWCSAIASMSRYG
jgi:hypothetical protein